MRFSIMTRLCTELVEASTPQEAIRSVFGPECVIVKVGPERNDSDDWEVSSHRRTTFNARTVKIG